MNKKTRYVLSICTLVLPSLVLAQGPQPFSLSGELVAPAIYDTANLTQASNGSIVYDSKTDSFYAKGPYGTSDWRSFSQGLQFVGTKDLGTCTTSKTVDWSTGSVFTVSLTSGSTCTFTFTNKMSGQNITIWVTNDSASSGTGAVTWPTSKWAGGTPPTMTTGASALDVCTFTYNGSAVAGSCVQDMQ